jgi:hypothetical protein
MGLDPSTNLFEGYTLYELTYCDLTRSFEFVVHLVIIAYHMLFVEPRVQLEGPAGHFQVVVFLKKNK